MNIDMNDLMTALQLLVIGWGGDFLVLGVIALSAMGLCKAFPPKKD